LSSKGWWEVLQLVDECDGLVSAILHVRGDELIGTNRATEFRADGCNMTHLLNCV
jgi:hypothetical protein